MKHHPFVTTRRGSPNLYFRRKLPLDVQALLGRKEVWASLGTTSFAHATEAYAAAQSAYERTVADARLLATAGGDDTCQLRPGYAPAGTSDYHPLFRPAGCALLAHTQVARFVQRYRAHVLASDAETRSGMSYAELDAHEQLLEDARQQTRRARAANDLAFFSDTAEHILESERVWLPAGSGAFTRLLELLAGAEIELLDEQLRRVRGENPDPVDLVPLIDPDDTWEAAVRRWTAENAPQPKTVNEVRRQAERFRSVVDLPLSELTPDHVEQFKQVCLDREGLSHSRVNTILSLLSPVITIAMRRNLTGLERNPFSGAKFGGKAVRSNTACFRDAFTIDELNLLYASPVYTQGLRPRKGGADAAYWLPLLAPHTGARVEDLCRLQGADIVQRDGHWCFHLHDTKREKRMALPKVMRWVPVHRTLLELGWLDYVASRRALGATAWLFPDLHINQYGQRSAVFSNWFNEYLDGIPGLDDPRLVFHSFRHTLKAFAEESGVRDRVIEELIGHASDNDYGRKEDGEKRLPLNQLVEAIERLRFPGLKLGHLSPWRVSQG
ncbi:DUF6538 domain-containing protein [Paraburkholderia denitrificans]|uniref:DUF6538 domain-containing protein n=1 Tax=Paraburkholderia denitrificans TaxID=694025 RepID=A0ABW0JEA2_9BURK